MANGKVPDPRPARSEMLIREQEKFAAMAWQQGASDD
jgi:hypothetical protein